MEKISFYSAYEIVTLVTAVLIGTGAYLGFVIKIKQQKIKFWGMFWIFIMNLFVTYFCSELLNVAKLTEYKGLVQLGAAYAGQYFLTWLDKRSFKILDSLPKKVGIDLNNNSEDNNQNSTDNE